MRFKIVFDKDLVSSKYIKSWFVVDNEEIQTSEILARIRKMFNIQQFIYIELDDFIIPDNQIFNHIVKEDEIVFVKSGRLVLNPSDSFKSAFCEKKAKTEFISEKIFKKAIKNEDPSSSSSSKSSSNSPLPTKRSKKVLSESSDSSSSEKIQRKPNQKVVKKAPIPIKSLKKKQPEAEYIPKPIFNYNPDDFENALTEDIQLGDEVIFKSLELLENNTPGLSDYKHGKIIDLAEDSMTIKLLRENYDQELAQINDIDLVDELYLEKFQQTLEKNMICELKRKKVDMKRT
ncbi:hypothetical protein SteCoe_26853 [Stentor coeruleus]|uniref:Coilin n=1 Tax=Stentor coeruleus TaxID=5963 RepID=A0A1R2BBX7_9CILI|nr:hypothetical protein SteCoe_26853 [Stentor coeruleus]